MPATTQADYGNISYWDERYAAKGEGQCFDWYQDWNTLRPVLAPYLPSDKISCEVLIPGCGNSRMGADLHGEGYMNITNIDISSVVISQMADRFKELEQMSFVAMDARNMDKIPEDTFDLIIDKALFDAQLCSDDNIINVNALVKEMFRVLKPGGVYLVVSHGAPESRTGYLDRPAQGLSWAVKSIACPKPPIAGLVEEDKEGCHYVYVCQK